jgi:hypothetical protein
MIIILLLLLVLMYIYINKTENFEIYWYGSPVKPLEFTDINPQYPYWQSQCPFWNSRIGQTSNMSYDLRGDPIIQQKLPFIWNNASISPIYNRSLC